MTTAERHLRTRATRQALLAAAPRRLLPGAALAALTVLMGMGLLGLSGWFIAATALAGLAAGTALVFDIFMPSAGIRLLALGRTLARYGERVLTHDATLAALNGLRLRLFLGWARAPAARALRHRPARLLFRLTGDLDALDTVYLRLLVPGGAALAAALLAGLVLGLMASWLGVLLALWLLALGLGTAVWLARRARVHAARRALAVERLRERVADLVAGQTELAMAGRLQAQVEAVVAMDDRLARADLQLHRLDRRAGALYTVAGSLTLAGVLLAAAALVEAGRLGTAGAALALLLALGAMEPFAALRRGALEWGRCLLAARRLAPRLAVSAPEPALQLPAPGLALQLRAIRALHDGSRLPALDDLSLEVAEGERVALIGPSGAGKSTVLALLGGELQPAAGQLRVQPMDWLAQRSELFHDTVRDNLRLADPQADDTRLWAALDAAGLGADVRGLPDGLGHWLGEGGLGLSGGQARRLALARLLLRDSPLWVLDEPTEGLDSATAADILARLAPQARSASRTVLLATHLRREAAWADRLVCLDAGRITAQWRRGEPGFQAALAALRPD